MSALPDTEALAKLLAEAQADAEKVRDHVRAPDWSGDEFDLLRWINSRPSAEVMRLAEHSLPALAAQRIADAARIAELEAALAELHRAVCGDTGFAAAVRMDSGIAYPWPALDAADAKARTALTPAS